MKLVEILAREMSNWPDDGTDVVGQAADGVLHLNASFSPNRGFTDKSYTMADDWNSADVTRADWEAERARIKGEKAMPKANKDGWIRHRGGKCPVDAGTLIDVRRRNGEVEEGLSCGELGNCTSDDAENSFWRHDGDVSEIMAWRPHKAKQIDQQEAISAFNEQTSKRPIGIGMEEMPSAKYFDGPLQWRDRIHTIDFDKAVAQKAHEAAMAALDSERAELVAKLKAEGLALVDAVPVGDMSNPLNWKRGDIVTAIDECEGQFTEGNQYVLRQDFDPKLYSVRVEFDDAGSNTNGWGQVISSGTPAPPTKTTSPLRRAFVLAVWPEMTFL